MTTNIANQVAFLRTSRAFPEQAQPLSVELDKAYIDTANAMNVRTIGLFPTNSAAQTGETWFVTPTRQEGFRQLYTFTAAGNIAHGLDLNLIGGFTKIYGTFTNGTNWYPLPYVDVSSSTNQVNVIVTPTNITITAGGGSPPSITSGFVVLEWISAL